MSSFVELICSTKIDHEELFCHNSMIIWFHNEHLSMNIQRSMQIELNQTFKYIRTFTDIEKFRAYVGGEFLVTTLKFIGSDKQAGELCSLIERKSSDYDSYELDIELWQSIRKNSNTYMTFSSIKELFRNITGCLKKSYETVNKIKQTSDDEDYTYKTFLPPLGISSLLSIPKSFHFLNKESLIFLLFQLLNKVILQMAYTREDLGSMCTFCRGKYQNNTSQMKKIAQLAKEYVLHTPVYHYTESSFLFRSLNDVFRDEDTDGIYEFRYYITDTYKQLKSLSDAKTSTSSQNEIILYRGIKLPFMVLQQLKELNDSKDVKDKLISVNGFFSTTSSQDVANMHGGFDQERDGYKSVMFTLKINRTIFTKVLYADITQHSCFPEEEETLFSMGSLWKLLKIDNCNPVWTIELELSNIFDNQLAKLHSQLLVHQSSEDYHIFLLAKVLHELGKYSQAGEFYHRLPGNKKLPENFKGLIYLHFARMRSEQGQYTDAQKYLEEVLRSKKLETVTTNETNSSPLQTISAVAEMPSQLIIMNNIGVLYQKKRDFLEARQHLKEAIKWVGNSVWSRKFKKDLENVEQQLDLTTFSE